MKLVATLRVWGWAIGLALLGIIFLVPFNETTYLNLPKLLLAGMAGGRYYIPTSWVDHSRIEVVDGPCGEISDKAFGDVFSFQEMIEMYRRCDVRVLYQDPEVAAISYCGLVFVITRDLVIRHIVSEGRFHSSQQKIIADARQAIVEPSCGPQKMNPGGSGGSTEAKWEIVPGPVIDVIRWVKTGG